MYYSHFDQSAAATTLRNKERKNWTIRARKNKKKRRKKTSIQALNLRWPNWRDFGRPGLLLQVEFVAEWVSLDYHPEPAKICSSAAVRAAAREAPRGEKRRTGWERGGRGVATDMGHSRIDDAEAPLPATTEREEEGTGRGCKRA